MAMAYSANRYGITAAAFVLGSSAMMAVYLGFLTWVQGWDYAFSQFMRDRAYVLPIVIAFGIESALYAILRFRLFMPIASAAPAGPVVGANGATSSAAMVACCLHHVTSVLPVLGIGAAAGFLARYQRPFMLAGLALNVAGILFMLGVLYRERQLQLPALEVQ
jgi:Cu+-exporting ATPase